MVSTVTVSSVTMIASMGLAATLSIFCIVLLICFLMSKELLTASSGARKRFLGRTLNISIIPLAICFAVIVALKVAEILS